MPTNSPEYVKKNYKKYFNNDKQREKSKLRMRALRKYRKENWPIPKWKELDHKRWLKAGNGRSNLRVVSRKTNRSLGAQKSIRVRKAKRALGRKY